MSEEARQIIEALMASHEQHNRPNYGCARCVPHEQDTIPGWICFRHACQDARDWIARTPGSDELARLAFRRDCLIEAFRHAIDDAPDMGEANALLALLNGALARERP